MTATVCQYDNEITAFDSRARSAHAHSSDPHGQTGRHSVAAHTTTEARPRLERPVLDRQLVLYSKVSRQKSSTLPLLWIWLLTSRTAEHALDARPQLL